MATKKAKTVTLTLTIEELDDLRQANALKLSRIYEKADEKELSGDDRAAKIGRRIAMRHEFLDNKLRAKLNKAMYRDS